MAMLTLTPSVVIEGTAEVLLAKRMVEAAAAHGFTIVSVLARSDGSGAEGGGLRGDGDSMESCSGIRSLYCASPEDGEDDGAAGREMGTITEVLASGLRLRISPLAFFQASTSAADVLFATILDLVARSSPDRRQIVDSLEPPPPAKPPSLPSPPLPSPPLPPPSAYPPLPPPSAYPHLLLDLCCGGGAIGLEVARAAAAHGVITRVVGIESCAAAVADARHNAALNGLHAPAYMVLHAKAEEGIEQALACFRSEHKNSVSDATAIDEEPLPIGRRVVSGACATCTTAIDEEPLPIGRSHGRRVVSGAVSGAAIDEEPLPITAVLDPPRRITAAPDTTRRITVVLDPPRTGLAPSVCKALRAESAIDRIVFVSCNPHGHTLRHDYVVKGGSLAANTKILCRSGGRSAPFILSRAIPVDLFPHTPHVELCLCFERVGAGVARQVGRRAANLGENLGANLGRRATRTAAAAQVAGLAAGL
jgi:SAM-dependent methyltransferase